MIRPKHDARKKGGFAQLLASRGSVRVEPIEVEPHHQVMQSAIATNFQGSSRQNPEQITMPLSKVRRQFLQLLLSFLRLLFILQTAKIADVCRYRNLKMANSMGHALTLPVRYDDPYLGQSCQLREASREQSPWNICHANDNFCVERICDNQLIQSTIEKTLKAAPAGCPYQAAPLRCALEIALPVSCDMIWGCRKPPNFARNCISTTSTLGGNAGHQQFNVNNLDPHPMPYCYDATLHSFHVCKQTWLVPLSKV